MALSVGFSLPLIGLALGAAILYTVAVQVQQYLKIRSMARAPSPVNLPWWDVLGMRLPLKMQAAVNENRLPEFLTGFTDEVAAVIGRPARTLSLRVLGRRGYMTTDPKNVQAILARQFDDFGLGNDRIGSFLPMLGVGIFSSDGSEWQHSRSMLRPSFARNRVEDLELEEKHGRQFLTVLPPAGDDGWTPQFDIQPLFYKLTMDSSTEFFFGESSGSLTADPNSLAGRFVGAFDRGQHMLNLRSNLGAYYWLKSSAEFRADCKLVHQWTDLCVERALLRYNQKKGQVGGGDDGYIFLDELIAQTQDKVALRSQLLNVLIAGRDTTAGLLSWTFLHLSRRPELYAQLRRIIIDTFGTYENPHDISFASLKNCKPLQNLLKEILRLHPGVPFNVRQALRDSSLPTGGGPNGDKAVFVPKGSQVFYSVYMMHRDKGLWGEDANEFRPERWETARPGWEYLPFNGGPRICLGQNFALTSGGYAVVRLVQRFDKVRTTDLRDLKVHCALTADSANGVHLSFHRSE